jgi:hypothetical protein
MFKHVFSVNCFEINLSKKSLSEIIFQKKIKPLKQFSQKSGSKSAKKKRNLKVKFFKKTQKKYKFFVVKGLFLG